MSKTEPRAAGTEFVEALARGLDVIQAFDGDTAELTLSEIAQRTGLKPATARRSLLTLTELGYVGMHGKRFLLCPKVLTLGATFLNSMNMKDIADHSLQLVADQFHDASSFAVMEGGVDVLYISHISSDRNIRFKARVGYRLPAYATSLGRVLLAFESDDVRENYLARAPFEAYTPRTITTREALGELLDEVRENGYAYAQDQLEYGVVSVAVPVRDTNGDVVAAINCSAQSSAVALPELIETRVPVLREAAVEIGLALKRYPSLMHSIYSHRQPTGDR